jgi:DNA polymerase-3 subunit beta
MTTATATRPKASGTTLKIPKAELLEALLAIHHATPARPAKPILANCRIGDGLVTGTDLEVRIDRAIAEQCEPFLVPHARLLAIVRAATGEDVTLTAKGPSVTVKCGGGKWELPTEDVAEYPTWEPLGLHSMPALPEDQFLSAVASVVHSTDPGSSRYALGGVLIESDEDDVFFVATDGRRLSRCICGHDSATDVFVGKPKDPSHRRAPIVPQRVMKIMEGLCHERGERSVHVQCDEKVVVFSLGDVTVTASLVQGEFPRWRDITGSTDGMPAVVYRQSFSNCVSAARIVASEQSKGIDLKWKEDELEIVARSSEYGQSQVTCPFSKRGTAVNTKLDPSYLIEFLNHLPKDTPEVSVFVASATDKVTIACDYDEDKKRFAYLGVIMPLAVE